MTPLFKHARNRKAEDLEAEDTDMGVEALPLCHGSSHGVEHHRLPSGKRLYTDPHPMPLDMVTPATCPLLQPLPGAGTEGVYGTLTTWSLVAIFVELLHFGMAKQDVFCDMGAGLGG